MQKLEWTALEYEEKERSADWFWALGIIVVTSSIAAVIFGNYFFAALLFLSGVMLGFFAVKKPDPVPYELNDKGLKIHSRLYPYENIKSFWVEKEEILFIKTERAVMPIITIPLHADIAGAVRASMLEKGVAEEEMKEHLSQKIMETLGF